MEYKNYLKSIRRYSTKTIEIYLRYAKELKKYNLDYRKLLLSKSNLSNSSIRIVSSAIICYYKYLNDKRYKEIRLPKKEKKVKDYISYDEYIEILKNINRGTIKGRMKRLIVRLLFETGIRSNELLWIKKKDIYKNRILIHGKGEKERFVYITPWLRDELEEYISTSKNERIFNFGYKNLYTKISTLKLSKKITPHMFRRGYAKYCFDNGISIYDISLSMGHSNINTTVGYINKNSDDISIYKIFNQI